MVLYIIYSADLVDIAEDKNELTLAFVDDTALLAVGDTFLDTHSTLNNMMEREGGAFEWSDNHNSQFEMNKFVLMDFTLNRSKQRIPITIRGTQIAPSPTHQFLGVQLDQELRWKAHTAYAIAKGMKHAIMLRWLSATTWGIPLKLMRQLYQAVITMVQRAAALAASGAMRTTPTDSLFAHAFLPPVPLMIQKTLYNTALRLASLPDKHPLHSALWKVARRDVCKHRSALHRLTHDTGVSPFNIETIKPHI
ncbi:hypothetical protein BKA83DRAFT_4467068 [Pisolithus microcarpus]|nr:hypothetical protein BKA83DRAFT_4467068 [Pisolithus microcarpus]